MMNSFFNNSTSKFASHFSNDKDVSLTELEEMKQILEEQIKKRKSDG